MAKKASKAGKARRVTKKAASSGKKQAKPRPDPKKRPSRKASGDFEKVPVRQIAARLRAHLVARGLDPVLTGRACASIYTGGSIKPRSIDFVISEYNLGKLEDAMQEIGFRETGANAYASKRCPVDVVFAPPSLAVGDDVVRRTYTVKAPGGGIKLLTPTDCVRERLSMYYQWGDREAFQDAIDVARRHVIEFDLIRRWSDHEWYADRYAEFLGALKEASEAGG